MTNQHVTGQRYDELKFFKGINRSTTGALIEIAKCSEEVFSARWDEAADYAVTQGGAFTLFEYCTPDGHLTHCRLAVETPKGIDTQWFCPRIYSRKGKPPYIQYSLVPPRTNAPLYGLQHLDPYKPILLVGNERLADAARQTLRTHNILAWCTARPDATDWAPIAAWEVGVVVWLDATRRAWSNVVDLEAGFRGYFDFSVADARDVNLFDLTENEIAERCIRAEPFGRWRAETDNSFCLLGDRVDSLKPCARHWNRAILRRDPYETGSAVPAVQTQYGEPYALNGRWPVGNAVCNKCDYAGLVERPADIAALTDLLRTYVYVVSLDRYVHLKSGIKIKDKALNQQYWSVHKKPLASQIIGNRPESVCDDVVQAFGYRRIIETSRGRLLNLWRPAEKAPAVIHTTKEPTHFLKVAGLCIPDDDARKIILDFIAYMIQRPHSPVMWMPIISGGQGTGKDSLLKPLQAVLGRENFVHVTQGMLGEQFNEYLLARLVVLQEIERGSWGTYQRLKAKITNDTFSINIKGLPRYQVEHKPSLICLTNDPHPVPVEEDDRRIYMYRSHRDYAWLAKRYSLDDIFTEFYCPDTGYMSQLPEFVHWCLTRDLSEFDPKRAQPSSAKTALLQHHLPPEALAIIEEIESERITRPMIPGPVLTEIMQSVNHWEPLYPAKAGRILRLLGIRKLNRHVMEPHGRPFIYLITPKTLKFCADYAEELGAKTLFLLELERDRYEGLLTQYHEVENYLQHETPTS